MFWLIRPDAYKALEDRGVKKALSRYVDVVENRKYAKFLICKSIEANFEKNMDINELRKIHDEKIEEFREMQRKIDGGDKLEINNKKKSLLDLKIEIARRMLEKCEFCERRCRVNRYKSLGFCRVGAEARLSSEFLHFGEEACLVPSHTFFFIGCNFYCVFCQNWTISRQFEKGDAVSAKELAEMAKVRRKEEGSRNVNLVGGDPTPNLHVILEMLKHLNTNVPIVWNSNMYLTIEAMKLLDGCVDVYLTDFKYGNNKCAERLSKVKNYFEVVSRNHLIAKEQAELIIRHLVLPNHVECCTKPVLKFIAENFDNEVRVNIMAQYRPEFEARKYEDISRRVSAEEMRRAFEIAHSLGLWNLD